MDTLRLSLSIDSFNEISKLITQKSGLNADMDFINIKQEYSDTLSYGSGITL